MLEVRKLLARCLVDDERPVGLIVAAAAAATVERIVLEFGRVDRASPAGSEHSNSHLVALVDASVHLVLEGTKTSTRVVNLQGLG